MGEKVLALSKQALFGRDLEDIFDGIISNPPNPIQEERGWMSLEELYRRYERAFKGSVFFYDKDIMDFRRDQDKRPKDMLQVVSYSVFITMEGHNVYVFVSDVAEKQASLKSETIGGSINLGWGGHVSDDRYKEWTRNGTVPNPYLLLHDAHTRELAEEVRIEDNFTYMMHLGWLYLPYEKDGLSPYHIGHLNLVKMPRRSSLVTTCPGEGKKSLNPRWMLLEEIMSSTNQAAWTRTTVPVIGFFARQGLL